MDAETQTTFIGEPTDPESAKKAIGVCVDNGHTFENLANCLDLDWPDEVYACTFVRFLAVGEVYPSRDRGIIVEMIPLALRQNIPGLADMVGVGLARDQVEYICRCTSATSSSGTSTKTENISLLVPYEEGVDTETLYGILAKARSLSWIGE